MRGALYDFRIVHMVIALHPKGFEVDIRHALFRRGQRLIVALGLEAAILLVVRHVARNAF